MKHLKYEKDTKELIDSLKTICNDFGLGNSGYEYKIITEVFLYKFLNDKFLYEIKNNNVSINSESDLTNLSEDEYEEMLISLGNESAEFKKKNLISYLHNKQDIGEFHKLFDQSFEEVSNLNITTLAVSTIGGEKIGLFSSISQYIIDTGDKSPFCKAIINKLNSFSFEEVFERKYDFFSVIFEYLIKDYNKDSGKYAEYYTPHSVAHIMSRILVPNSVKNVTLYDPAAGSGSLLLSLAHQIGEDKCSLFTQDISQKSSEFLRLNLILNNLSHSLNQVIKGNTLKEPYFKEESDLKKFDYIVSNPPFKVDFSADRETLAGDEHRTRFFAGVPKVPGKKKDSMAIYQLFIQHIMYSLGTKGKAAIVVPTGFCTEKAKIGFNIREKIIENKWLKAVVQMPSNIFATTGTNVSVIFLDKESKNEKPILVDASNLGTKIKEGKNTKTHLSVEEEDKIVNCINNREEIDDFSVIVDTSEIEEKGYSFGAGHYFTIKIDYVDLTVEEFGVKMDSHKKKLSEYFKESKKLEKEILGNFEDLEYGGK